MSRIRRVGPALALAALALAVPAVALAATKPGVSTLGAAKLTITTATLTGRVNPHGAATTYYFQLGTTTAYGSRTPDATGLVERRQGTWIALGVTGIMASSAATLHSAPLARRTPGPSLVDRPITAPPRSTAFDSPEAYTPPLEH